MVKSTHRHRRAAGGRDPEWDGKKGEEDRDDAPTDVYAGKGSNVAKEADERKRGGKVAKKREEKREDKDARKERKAGGRVEKLDGHGARHRLDRPGRKRGGGVGADKSPLSSAARTHDRREGSGEAAVTGGA